MPHGIELWNGTFGPSGRALAVRPRSVATHDATPPWATRPEHAIVAVRVGDEPALTQLARRPAGASSSGSMTPA
jgi:hypothetical protein